MAIRSRSVKPVSITNERGEPEIVLEIDGLTLSMAPPSKDGETAAAKPADDARPA